MADKNADLDLVNPDEIEKSMALVERELAKLAKLGAGKGLHYPDSDDADATGSEKDNGPTMRRARVKMHKKVDDIAEEDDADDEPADEPVAKAKKKPPPEPDTEDASGDADDEPPAKKRVAKAKADDADEGEPSEPPPPPADDEVMTIGGQEIRKSVVGDGSFAILKAQEDRIAKAEAAIRKERDLRLTAELQKRAQDDYPHVPGSLEQRGEMLKQMLLMPAETRKQFEHVLTAHEKMAKAAFNKVGINPADLDGLNKSARTFDTLVAKIRKDENCSRTDALSKARLADPEGFKAYQDLGEEITRQAN